MTAACGAPAPSPAPAPVHSPILSPCTSRLNRAGRSPLLALLFPSVFLMLWGSPIRAQGLEAVLEAHYKAAAQPRMDKIAAMITRGKYIYSMAGIESSFTIYRSRPDLIRVEGEFQGSAVVQT